MSGPALLFSKLAKPANLQIGRFNMRLGRGRAALSAPFQALALPGPLEKIIRLTPDPFKKACHLGMLAQGLDPMIVTGELGLAEECMYLPMANAVQPGRLHATARFGDQVMRIPLGWRNGAITQGTDDILACASHRQIWQCLQAKSFDAPLHESEPKACASMSGRDTEAAATDSLNAHVKARLRDNGRPEQLHPSHCQPARATS